VAFEVLTCVSDVSLSYRGYCASMTKIALVRLERFVSKCNGRLERLLKLQQLKYGQVAVNQQTFVHMIS